MFTIRNSTPIIIIVLELSKPEEGCRLTAMPRGPSGIVSVRCGDFLRLPGPDPMGAAGSGLWEVDRSKCGGVTRSRTSRKYLEQVHKRKNCLFSRLLNIIETPEDRKMITYSDFRSDTVTRPTEKMRKAMAEAVVGDDVLGDDPTVQKLEDAGRRDHGQGGGALLPVGNDGQFDRGQDVDEHPRGSHRRGAVPHLQYGIDPHDLHLRGDAAAGEIGARGHGPQGYRRQYPQAERPYAENFPHLFGEHPQQLGRIGRASRQLQGRQEDSRRARLEGPPRRGPDL